MIELKNISKSFPVEKETKTVLKDITLSVQEGEMLAIMGASGSGKSTLLNILGCLEKAGEGTYLYKGKDITAMSSGQKEAWRRDHIAFVFQQFALIDDMTIKENIELPLKARNIPKKRRKELIEEYAKKLKIDDQLNKKPHSVSGGQQQRCAIARALVTGNAVILADEPTGALDQKTGLEIMELLKDMTKDKKTVIVVTHDEKVAQLADRIIHIEDGCVKE